VTRILPPVAPITAMIVLFALSGCLSFDRSGVENGPPVDIDAGAETGVDAMPACTPWAFNPTDFDPCAFVIPTTPLELDQAGTYVYDTDIGELRDPTGSLVDHTRAAIDDGAAPVLAVFASEISIGVTATLRATGSRGLILAATTTIQIAGTVDVGSSFSSPGAGANGGMCNASADGESDPSSRTGGGGGGSFSGVGGSGGRGDLSQGGLGGAALADPTLLRGGCPGGAGGGPDDNTPGPDGGPGGGGVLVVAGTSITIAGVIHAGGAGGQAGAGNVARLDQVGILVATTPGGGGGGGSGGMIAIESLAVSIGPTAVLAANGGGGGSGNDDELPGVDGQDGRPDAQSADGGGAGSGQGGDGSAGDNRNGLQGSNDGAGSGGGGGGAAGFILLRSAGPPSVAGAAVLSPRAN